VAHNAPLFKSTIKFWLAVLEAPITPWMSWQVAHSNVFDGPFSICERIELEDVSGFNVGSLANAAE
jgi:hypothetical protein